MSIVWTDAKLREMIDLRISAKTKSTMTWADLDDGSTLRGKQGKWGYIVARSFMRPRDIISYLNYALKIALQRDYSSSNFSKDDIYEARSEYSEYLRNELSEELGPHWPQWEEAMRVCSAIVSITMPRSEFVDEYNRRKSEANPVSASRALEWLFEYSAVGFRRGTRGGGSQVVFKYLRPQDRWDQLAQSITVHVGLKDYYGLSEKGDRGVISGPVAA